MADSLNCTFVPAEAASDGGVAGAGVLLSFIITAGIALLMSAIIVLHEIRRQSEAKVLRKLLLSLSDQQLLTGIGIQCVALAKMKTMVSYHFFIVWMLSLLSTCTHIGTLLALVNDFKRDWVLRWLRQFLVFVNLCLSVVSGIFILLATMRDLKSTLPIACVWQIKSEGAPSNAGTSIAGTIAVMTGQVIFFVLAVWYLHVKERKWIKAVQTVGILGLIAIGTGAAVRVILLSQAFGTPSVPLSDTGEKDWSFGQLLPLLLLLLPLISAVEIMRGMTPFPLDRNAANKYLGEMKVPSPVVDDQAPLLMENKIRSSFQPNPFWGQRTRLFSKY